MGFTHLHIHSQYSLLDGACVIERLVKHVKSIGQRAVAVTDHGAMYGAVEFYKAAKAAGIKPIIGCELYVASRKMSDKTTELDRNNYHLILLAKNNQGYKNLIKLVSEAWTEGFYSKPRVDHERIRKYSDGLICLSACLAGEIPQALLNGNYEGAKALAQEYLEIFGEGNYYIEIQNHGLSEQIEILPQLIRLSKETGIPLVATNDAHYISRDDAETQRVLMCIQMGKTLDDPNRIGFETEEFYVKTEEEMREVFPDCQEAIDITETIADMCDVTFEFGNTKLPHFDVPGNADHFEYFKEQCEKGLLKRYGDSPSQEIKDRLYYELDVINKMGYVDYYLIVHDFIRAAREMGIPVGPGRGSGAGSIAAYAIGITGLDPIKYNLIFERFLNPERVSMPDFDIDFCYERRQEVIDYVIRKYGADHVAQIVTFGTMAARAAIRDVGRVLGMGYSDVDAVAKAVPNELNMTLERALETSPTLKEMYQSVPGVKRLMDISSDIEGMPRHTSMHAAGVVITRDPVMDYVPLAKSGDAVVTQFTMTTLEELGLLKMDFLGLRTLTVIHDCCEEIRHSGHEDFDIEDIPLDDMKVCNMIADGYTEGVFQFESEGMRRVLQQLRPEGIEDLIAVISLYRPGPMESIPRYISNKHNPDKIKYKAPQLKPILESTYGCIVYQEQVMQIVQKLAGYSLGRADLVRRAMSKKKASVMNEERQNFVYGKTRSDGTVEVPGAVANGISAETANSIFDEMVSFASYAFNKSHAACYALVAYQTAYLKHYYPCEFMAAILTSVLGNTDKTVEYINECERLGIKILPPDVNSSTDRFAVENGRIRFSLAAVKNLGKGVIRFIVSEREANGRFTDFTDLCKRVYGHGEVNKRVFESLIKCGACDGLAKNRRQMFTGFSGVLESLDAASKRNVTGQLSLFDSMDGERRESMSLLRQLPNVDEFSVSELLAMEKESIGLYLSGHPLAGYSDVFSKHKCMKIAHIKSGIAESRSVSDGDYVNVLTIISSKKLKTTRNNGVMAFLTVEDDTASCEVLVFPAVLEKYSRLIQTDSVAVMRCRVSVEDDDFKLVAHTIASVSEDVKADSGDETVHTAAPAGKILPEGLYLKVSSKSGDDCRKAVNMIRVFEGTTPVSFRYSDTGAAERAVKLSVELNEVLIRELKRLLGEDNVVAVYRQSK